MRRWLPAAAYDHAVTVLMAFLALLVLGSIAWSRIHVQMMPSGFELNELWVWVPLSDASPREADEDLVRPIAAQLQTIPGIDKLRSRASSGSASFSVEFHQGTDMGEAYNAVVDRLERALPELPDDVDRYFVFRYNPDDEPVVWAGVSFPDTVEDPHHVMTRVVQPRLERIPGVAKLDVWGVPEQLVYVDYDRERLMAHGVSLGELQGRLLADNFQIAGGKVLERGQERYVRSLSRIDDVDTLRRYPVAPGVVLEDVATVELRSARSVSINRVDGLEGAAFGISKESTANTVDVCAAVDEALAELAADPRSEGAEFFVFFSQGEIIEDSMRTLLDSALTGGVFAVVILFVFLREWRMTLLIAASIPFSLLITVGIVYFRGGTLNLLTLMGLMLAVGMVVDNAIVVVETIYQRRNEGMGARAAAIMGSAEVNLAIVASTLTTMVVFLPLILMSDNATVSFFMGEIGYPVVFALLASLVVALVFAPLATRYVGRAHLRPDARWLTWLTDAYGRALGWLLAHRADAAALLAIVAVLTLAIPVSNVKVTDESEGNINDFTIRFSVPPQADPARRDALVRTMEELVEGHRDAWGVRVYRSRLGEDDLDGRVYVYLEPDGPMAREDVMKAAKEALPTTIPGVVATIGWEDAGGGSGNTISVDLTGEDAGTLDSLAEEVARRVRTMPGVLATQVELESVGSDELRLVARRDQLARYAVSASTVGQTVSYAMRGTELPPLRVGEREITVASRFELADRERLEVLRDFPVFSPATLSMVPLRALTDVAVAKGPGTIRRVDGRTSTSVTVDLDEDVSLTDAFELVERATADMAFPRGYELGRGDRWEDQASDSNAQSLAALLSFTFVLLLMGVLFESFVLPLAIMTTVPMAMVGAFWGLYLTGTALDGMAIIGLIILIGVVVNNGIVLVDLITQLRHEGVERIEAIVTAGRRRLRPILLTALTTICGLVPMALGSSSFIGIPYAPLGRAVASGMIAGTLLTLLFVPFMYVLLDDLREASRAWLGFVVRARPVRAPDVG